MEQIELTINSVDYAPPDLYQEVPFRLKLIRQIPGPDRPDYWLGELVEPFQNKVTHLIVSSRWVGYSIVRGVNDLPVGIAYVIDSSVLTDKHLDFSKCQYVAIGTANDTT